LTHKISVTFERILIKLDNKNYHLKSTPYAKLHLHAMMWVVCANTKIATVWVFCLSLFGLLVMRTGRTSGRFLPRDSYAKRGICRRCVSVCVSVCHTPVLYQNG